MRRKDRDLGAQAALEILDECEYATISHVYYADEIDANCDNLAQENSADFTTNSGKITSANLDTNPIDKTRAKFSMSADLDEISSQILADTTNTDTNLIKIKGARLDINFHKLSNKNAHFSDTLNTKSNMSTLKNFHTRINLCPLNINSQTSSKFDLNQILNANFNDNCIKFKMSIAPIKDINSRFFSTHKNRVSTKFSTQSDQICAFKPEQISTPPRPQIFSIPISIVRENESIFIHGAPRGAKAKLLQNGREVTIVAVSFNRVPTPSKSDFNAHSKDGKWLGSNVFTTEYKSAIATAKAYEITDPKAKFHALKILSQKYVASAQMKAFDVAAMHSLNITNIYELKIISLSAKAKILPKK